MEPIYKLNVNEESPIGFVVGNIQKFVMDNFYGINKYEVTCLNKIFSISSNKDVTMTKVVDLERICELENFCCNEGLCIIGSVVHLSNEDTKKYTFRIEIEIKDINDNMPIFRNPIQSVFIPENSRINSFVRLDTANDNDVTPINKIQRYQLTETTNTFNLDSTDLYSLKLVLQQPLDYETTKSYNATLSACELKANCTSQRLIINVEDENDNLPKFQRSKYEIKIKENVPVKSIILKVVAVDLDGPKFNKTIYNMYSPRERFVDRYFIMVPETGNIVLRSKLSASVKRNFRFKVTATDATLSRIGDSMDIAEVVIDVIDINDHRPTIEVILSERVSETNKIVKIRIKELELPQKLMMMKVTDEDLDNNGKVECDLKDHNVPLELRYFPPGLYELSSTTTFDYEKDTNIRVVFECKDGGVPPLVEYRTIDINIEDVNEFAPVFQTSEYSATLRENAAAGTLVLHVRATDRDGSASLMYSIDDAGIMDYFTINRDTGAIKTTSNSFDKESIDTKEFFVSVSDDKDQPKTAQALLKIEILDANDNDPVFIVSSLQFFVLENKHMRTKLSGMLNATDRDREKDNSFVTYELVRLFDHTLTKCDKPMFRIKASGEIETLMELDRETTPNYTLTVKAQDHGTPPRASYANATVYVRDVNDNAPQWQYPRLLDARRYNDNYQSIPMLNISESTDKMTLILKLKAHDVDESDAGKVTYILQNHSEEMFALNATTGELITITAPLRHGQYKLQLTAKDNGSPPLQSVAWILINVLDSGKLANINLTIIIGMIAITVLISIFLIVAIICVRRRPRFQKYLPSSSEVVNDNSNQYFNHNHWMYHTEDNPMPPMSDNESFVFLPQQYCGAGGGGGGGGGGGNHADQMAAMQQAMNTSRPASRMEYPLTLPSSNNFNTLDNANGIQMNQNIDVRSLSFSFN